MSGKLKTALFFAAAGLFIGGGIAFILAGLILGALIGAGIALLLGLGFYWRMQDSAKPDRIADKR